MNRIVLASGTTYFSDEQQINPFMNSTVPIDHTAAKREHEAIMSMLGLAGIEVVRVQPPEGCQDGVFTANWALVRGKKAVMANLPNARKAEEAYAKKTLEDRGIETFTLPNYLKFSGQGDALPCGNLLFCGKGYRADEEAQALTAKILGYTRIQLQTVPLIDADGTPVINASSGWADSFYYDIDLALSIIKAPKGDEKGVIAYCPEAFCPESRLLLERLDDVEKILVSEYEAKHVFACNLVSTGEAVVMSDAAPELAAAIEARGLRVYSPKIVELIKGGGYIRCTTLTLE